MKRITFVLAAALTLGALTLSLPKFGSDVQANPVAASVAATFGDACRNVTFKFKNQHNSGGKIKFQRIKFFNKATGNWETEDVNNVECSQGATCATTENNLRDSEGERLTKFRLIYKFLATETGSNWSDEVESGIFEPTKSVTCNAGRQYGGQQWVIR